MSQQIKSFPCVFLCVLFSLAIHSVCYCKKRSYDHLETHSDVSYIPWFTGPLLSPTPVNMLPGHPAIEPSITIGNNYGKYDSHWRLNRETNEWFINPFLDFQLGFTDRMGLEILTSCISNFKKGASATRMQDTILLLGFQIANDVKGRWIPDIRIDLQETLPTGSYQKLNPENCGTDSTGQGAFQTGPLLIIHKLFYPGNHFLALKVSLSYLFPSNVKVKGYNTYGGGAQTNGIVHPGQTLTTFFSAEYSISQRWGWGFDSLLTYQKKSTFSGRSGRNTDNQPVSVDLPSSVQISLAPFLEYNFSSRMGVLGGSWFTIAGKNSLAFLSGYFAFLYIF
jgi:hypothetical protein